MPEETAPTESFDLWALKERYRSEIAQVYDVWRIYIAWYTVFLTFNVAALVFYKQIVDAPSGAGLRRLLIGLFFVLQNGCAVVTSVLIARFSTRAYAALDTVLVRLSEIMPAPRDALDLLTKKRPLIPRDLMIRGAWFNVTGPGSLAIIWLLLTFSVTPATVPPVSPQQPSDTIAAPSPGSAAMPSAEPTSGASPTTTWDGLWLPLLLGVVSSVLTVALLAAREHWSIHRAANHYLGRWNQFIIGPSRRPEPDPENCQVEISRPYWWRPNVLHLRATHVPPGQPTPPRVWEGQLVIDRALHNRGVVAWAYTSPLEEREFGVYDLHMHDNGELFVTPALPPLKGEYLRFVLRRAET